MAGNYMECVRCNSEDGTIRSLKAWLLTFPRRWLSERAKSNVTPTAWLGDVVQLPRMVTIHHGLPHGGAIMPVEPDVPKIVFVGRLVSTKGVHVLLKAVSFLRDHAFRLEVIGEGPERENLEEEVRGLHLEDRVVFRGFLATDDAEELLALRERLLCPLSLVRYLAW
jgi:glycosyltransferase involved in cell wall biosynthesis